MTYFAIIGANPELFIALLIAKAQAIVTKISHEIYLVYFFGGKIFVHAMMIVVIHTKKNMSNFMPGTISFIKGNSPMVAPAIINTSKPRAR